MKKKRTNHDKTKLNTTKFLISKAITNSYFNHEKLISVNNVLREYDEIKEEIKNPKNTVKHTL